MRTIDAIMEEIIEVIEKVDEEHLKGALKYFVKERRIFVDGEGRSGFQAKGFAMRLMHLGYNVYVIGETITPSLKIGDVYISVSGSGTSRGVLGNTERAKNLGLTVLTVTSKKDSPVGKLSEYVIEVPGKVKDDDNKSSIQLLSSLFDQSVHIVLDTLCLLISQKDNMDRETVKNNHINI